MPFNADDLERHLREQQELKGLSITCRWYVELRNAIKHLRRAAEQHDPAQRFTEAYRATQLLFRLYGPNTVQEWDRFSSWVKEIRRHPYIREGLAGVRLPEVRDTVLKAGKQLLWDTQRKPSPAWRGCRADLLNWQAKEPDPRESAPVFLQTARDVRNALQHESINPDSPAVRRALDALGQGLVPTTAAAIRVAIEEPPAGTTGKGEGRASYLWPLLKNQDSFFSDYYLRNPFCTNELPAIPEAEARKSLGRLAARFRNPPAALARADAAETRQVWCEPVLFPLLGLRLHAGVELLGTALYRPDFIISRLGGDGVPRATYRGKEASEELACLVWVVPWGAGEPDAPAGDGATEGARIMELAQRALIETDVPWALLTNGRELRLLSREKAHRPLAFFQADLEAIADRPGTPEALEAFRYTLALLSQEAFVPAGGQGPGRLERVAEQSRRQAWGLEIDLRESVFRALEIAGEGLLAFLRGSPETLEAWRRLEDPVPGVDEYQPHSERLAQRVYETTLVLMYRLLFVLYSESRNLLPLEEEAYYDTYSLQSERHQIQAAIDTPGGGYHEGEFRLWERLQELFSLINGAAPSLVSPYNGDLFDPAKQPFLAAARIGDYWLSRAIDLLSRPRIGRGPLRMASYRDLSVRELGSIYEGLLDYYARLADTEYVVLESTIQKRPCLTYKRTTELTAAEQGHLGRWRAAAAANPAELEPPPRCPVRGVKEPGSFLLEYGKRESRRRSSGTYYTPEHLVDYLVTRALGPVLEPAGRGPLSAAEILELRVLDPAMGSGHFLVTALDHLARAYRAALAREGHPVAADDESGLAHHRRQIVERCLYGVDRNPMAVELAKLSLWLRTMDPGYPVSYLRHHFKPGDSLVGARMDRVAAPAAGNLFHEAFRKAAAAMVADVRRIIERETASVEAFHEKDTLTEQIEWRKEPFRNILDASLAPTFGDAAPDLDTLLSDVELARGRVSSAAREREAFHWELEFPEVFFAADGSPRTLGFSVLVGNPPWIAVDNLGEADKKLYRREFSVDQKFDLAHVFVAQGLQLGGPGARLGFVIPEHSWIGEFHTGFRKLVLEQCRLEEVGELKEGDFADVANPGSLFVAEKRPSPPGGRFQAEPVQVFDGTALARGAEPERFELPMPAIIGDTGLNTQGDETQLYRIFFDRLYLELKQHLDRVDWQWLDRLAVVSDGVKTGDALTELMVQAPDPGPDYVRALRRGKELPTLYAAPDWNQWWMLRPEKAAHLKKRNGFSYDTPRRMHCFRAVPKVVLRQTEATLFCTLDTEGFYFPNSIFCLAVKDGVSLPLSLLLALLNSTFYRALYMLAAQVQGTTKPQMYLNQIKSLPIPMVGPGAADPHDRTVIRAADRQDWDGILDFATAAQENRRVLTPVCTHALATLADAALAEPSKRQQYRKAIDILVEVVFRVPRGLGRRIRSLSMPDPVTVQER